MRAILSLLGHSPFAPLQKHMEQVNECVELLEKVFEAFLSKDMEQVEKKSVEISDLEHVADQIKNDIRNHLPNSLFLPVDRGNLLEILSLQDSLADKAEDIGILLTMKLLTMPENMKTLFDDFVVKNIEAYRSAKLVIEEMNSLLEASFGGVGADKVRQMVDDVAYLEHQGDLLQRYLLMKLYNSEGSMSFQDFTLWMRIIDELGSVADISEKLANRVRMTLELK